MNKFDHSYIEMAGVWAQNSYCKRRQVGALLVKDRMIISDGYNGTPSGFENICEDENGVTKPYVLHAEANAIISAEREKMIGSTIYLSGREVDTGEYITKSNSCSMCKRMIINAGIETVIVRDTENEYRIIQVQDWIENDESISGTMGY
jgi:dCMP deaminase